MKIQIDSKPITLSSFSSLPFGSVFKYGSCFYIKIDKFRNDVGDAIEVSYGIACIFKSDTLVTPMPNAVLVIKEE